MKPKLVKGDLLDYTVDVIVNAWNRNVIPWWLLIPQGVSRAIKKKAGFAPFRELAQVDQLRPQNPLFSRAGGGFFPLHLGFNF